MSDTIIPHPEQTNTIIANIKSAGPSKLHVLADFDHTLSTAYNGSERTPAIIQQIRLSGFLTPEYFEETTKLFDKYFPMERDPDLPYEEKNAAMDDWWNRTFELMIKCGLTKPVINKIVAQKQLKFRPGALEFIDKLHKLNIPLIIMSASLTNMVAGYLEQEGRLYPNVHIISNELLFNKQDIFIGAKEPIIHSLNKYEIILKQFPIYDQIKNRPNVILMGDNIDDIGMIKGFDYENLLKVGFFNDYLDGLSHFNKKRLTKFEETFDIIIPNDGGMEELLDLV